MKIMIEDGNRRELKHYILMRELRKKKNDRKRNKNWRKWVRDLKRKIK